MATATITVSNVTLTSWWYEKRKLVSKSNGSTTFEYYTTTPSSESAARTFSLAGIPAGSIIHAASLNASRGQEANTSGRMDGVAGTANKGAIAIAPSRIAPGGSLTVNFSYQADGRVQFSLGYKSMSAVWTDIALTVEYTPYTACSAPSQVALNKTEAVPGEKLILSWSGAKAGSNVSIAGYEIHRAGNADGPYALLQSAASSDLSAEVYAPQSPGSYHYKVKTLCSVSGYDSALSAGFASVSMSTTAPSAPTSPAVSPASMYPEGEAVLSWSPAQGGQNNPVTGYDVYQSAAPDGPFTFLKSAEGASCSVAAPQAGSLYFKVLARGQYLNGQMSAAAAVLTADRSGTSDFFPEASVADAGTPLTLILDTNIEKAHTLTASIGSFSQTVESPAGADSLSFTPPLSWLEAMPDSETSPLTLRLLTQGAGTVIKTVSLRCPDSVVPTGMGGGALPSSPDVPGAWGVYLSALSAASVTLDTAASAPYGASIVGYAIDGPGLHVEGASLPLEGVSGVLSEGEAVYLLSATDSRGRTGAVRLTIPVLPYEGPTLSSILSLRADDQGQEQDEGVYIRCTATPVFSSCGGHNAVQCAVDFRKQGESAWQSAGFLSNGQLVFGGGLIALPDNWEVRYTITDALENAAVYYDIVTRAAWEMHVKRGGGAWAFGGVADQDRTLKVYGNIQAEGLSLSGMSAAPTAAPGTDSAQLATTAFVTAALAGAVYDSGMLQLTTTKNTVMYYQRVGRVVTVIVSQGELAQTKISGFVTIATIPYGFRPPKQLRVRAITGDGNFIISTGGAVLLSSPNGGSYFNEITITYITADDIPS